MSQAPLIGLVPFADHDSREGSHRLTSLLSFVASIDLGRVPPARLVTRVQWLQAQVRLVPARLVRRVCVGPLAAMV